MVSYRATNSFAPNGRCCTLDDLKFMIDKTYDVGLVVPRDVVPRPAQNIENSHYSAMMEAVNGAKDLNVSVPAIEVFIISQPLRMSIWVNEPMDIIKCSDKILKA
ncbi:1,4-alpha-glucan-branching enzyme 1, chloroplastic/amyloplastic-like protein isoform X3 [Tanacetum coccineum]